MIAVNQSIARETEARSSAMSHQLMGQAAGDTGNQQIPDCVLQDRPMTLIDKVANIVGVGLSKLLVCEAEVTDASRQLNYQLGAVLRVGLPRCFMVAQEALYFVMIERLASDQIYLWF
jgi:hypothetical protein